ncbi:MAG: argininosuccinate lyase [Bacteroidota bacterium]
MKLWSKGFDTDKKIDIFTVGNDRELDLQLAKYDVIGNKAHAEMLNKIGLISDDEIKVLIPELDKILEEIERGEFTIDENFEDVHSRVEYMLTERLGDVGKKIHSARSRNDQVLVDLHLYSKVELGAIKQEVKDLFDKFIALSEQYKKALIPGYTHLQVAMPSSFGMWFGAYAESLIDDMYFINAAYKVADQNPLGSAAGYGSSFPIDREFTTEKLGFSELKVNSVAAQMGRGKLEKSISFAIASVAGTLSKMSADVCLYMSQNFGFLTFPDELTTGSSIMPHKKNPDVFELIRGKCNKLQALPMELTLIQNNLTSGYHRDLQMLKESFVPAIATLKSCLEMSLFMFENVEINTGVIENDMYKYAFSVEEVNKRVLEGMPFRDAYKEVGLEIHNNEFDPVREANHTHIGSVGNLRNDLLVAKMEKAMKG